MLTKEKGYKMKLPNFKNAGENEVLAYVVFKESTLGYLFKIGNTVNLGVLHGSVLKGGLDWLNGPYDVTYQMDKVRVATKADFDDFRVSSKGHI